MPKPQARSTPRLGLQHFGIRASDFLHHWGFLIRHSPRENRWLGLRPAFADCTKRRERTAARPRLRTGGLGSRIGESAVEGGLKSFPPRKPDLACLAGRRCSAAVQRQPRPVGRGVGWKRRKFRFGRRFRIGNIRPSRLFSSPWHDSCTTRSVPADRRRSLPEPIRTPQPWALDGRLRQGSGQPFQKHLPSP
jgi:hypothetical protein